MSIRPAIPLLTLLFAVGRALAQSAPAPPDHPWHSTVSDPSANQLATGNPLARQSSSRRVKLGFSSATSLTSQLFGVVVGFGRDWHIPCTGRDGNAPEKFFHLTGHGCGEPHRMKSENDDGHVTALD